MESFQKLQSLLITTSILTLLLEEEGFIMYGDASQTGLGCILMQKSEIIAYTSRKLKVHTNHDLDFAVMVFALKI